MSECLLNKSNSTKHYNSIYGQRARNNRKVFLTLLLFTLKVDIRHVFVVSTINYNKQIDNN